MKRYVQSELAARYARAFSHGAGRLNGLAIDAERARHERAPSPLAVRYRRATERSGPQKVATPR